MIATDTPRVGLAQRVAARISRAVGRLHSGFRPGLRILMYHAVGRASAETAHRFSVSPREFAAQMRWLKEESGLQLVRLDDGVQRLATGSLDGTAVAVTFDDGYIDLLTDAAPILQKYDVPFSAFITGQCLTHPPVAGRYLDTAALRDLSAIPGAAVGAHGYTHRPLTRLDDATLGEELRLSRATLADVLGEAPDAMSYPHGAIDGRVTRHVRAAGFHVGATSLAGVNGPDVPLFSLRRTEITGADALADFAGKVRGDFDWYQLKQRVYWPVPRVRETEHAGS